MVDHFHSLKGLAHTYLTFEFGDGTCLSFSLNHDGKKVSATILGTACARSKTLSTRWFPGRRNPAAHHGRGNKDYMFGAATPPEKNKELLMGMIQKLNDLAVNPEWYHSLFTTCNTSIVQIVNQVTPGRSPFFGAISFPATLKSSVQGEVG